MIKHIKLTLIFFFSFLTWLVANCQNACCINNYINNKLIINNNNNNKYIQYNKLINNNVNGWKNYLGVRLMIGGIGSVFIVGVVAYATGTAPETNPTISSSRLTYKQQCELADVGWFGFSSLLIGAGLEFICSIDQRKHMQKISIIGKGNRVGIAYNFR